MAAVVERVIGGPGTGKTHFLLSRLTAVKEEKGLSESEIGLCTFTRAGRAELSERAAAAWGVEPEALTKHGWFRTAHSIAHKQCEIAEGSLIQGSKGAAWVSQAVGGRVVPKYDRSTEETVYVSDDGDPTIGTSLRAWELARNRMQPLSAVLLEWSSVGDFVPSPESAMNVIERYELAKARDGCLDFTDMVARYAGVRFNANGPYDCEPVGDVPEDIRVLAIDEAQDSSALVDRVCRRLAASDTMELVILTGDPYQSVFRFGGSDFKHFLSWDAEESTMPQSHRCPPRVMEFGERCIRRMRHGYKDRGILPAGHHGSVLTIGSAGEAVSRLNPEESSLILGRCTFSLEEYESSLRRSGIPYTWVDKQGSSAELSGFQCLWDLEHGSVVTGDEWAAAIKMTPASHIGLGKFLVHGEKKAWADGRRSHIDMIRPTEEDLVLAGATPAWASVVLKGEWPQFVDTKRKLEARRWHDASRRWGPELASNPKVRLSTIHSAKGLEGDTVILSTISSAAVTRARQRLAESHDEECRVNYVAVTRARRDLIVVNDAVHDSLELPA